MQKSYDELSWGCPSVWAAHPQPARRPEPEAEVSRADMAAIAEDCRRRQEAQLRDAMVRRWPRLFWAAKREGGER